VFAIWQAHFSNLDFDKENRVCASPARPPDIYAARKRKNRLNFALHSWRSIAMAPLPLSPSTMIILMVVEALFAIPAGLVLKRTGHSMWWSLLCFVPIAALFGLWVLALTRWTPPRPVTE
jgi:hypothetical protein